MPTLPVPRSTRLSGVVSLYSLSAAMRSVSICLRRFAFAGAMTYFVTSFLYGRTSRSILSPVSTSVLLWQMRVVTRKSTGVSNFSEISKASLT